MSGEALLATPARPLYEPSHRPSKKEERPKSLSFCSDNTATDDQRAASVHLGPIAAVTVCPTPSVTRFGELLPISELGQKAKYSPRADVFRFGPPITDIAQ
jgi:hypothetical protein